MDPNTIAGLITAEAQRQGVPVSIALAVAQRESQLNQNARGSSGEIGVFQLMPGTAAGLGVNPSDLTQNIYGGVRYLAQMATMFGDWAAGIAAFNDGPGNVQNWLAGLHTLPDRTIAYVRSVTGTTLPSRITVAGATDQSPAPSAPITVDPSTGRSPNYVPTDTAPDGSTGIPISLIVFGVLSVGAGLLWWMGE